MDWSRLVLFSFRLYGICIHMRCFLMSTNPHHPDSRPGADLNSYPNRKNLLKTPENVPCTLSVNLDLRVSILSFENVHLACDWVSRGAPTLLSLTFHLSERPVELVWSLFATCSLTKPMWSSPPVEIPQTQSHCKKWSSQPLEEHILSHLI